MDSDGRKDIVAFGDAGLYTARSLVDGTFGANTFVYSDGGASTRKKCLVRDLNGDGYGDLFIGASVQGAVTYTGRWYPEGRTIVRFRSAYNNGDQILFVKYGYSPSERYTNASAVLALPSNGSLAPADIAKIKWVNSDGSVDLHGCLLEAQPSQNAVPSLVFNLDWTK